MLWDTTFDDAKDNPKNEQRQIKATYDDKTEYFFDDNEMRWKTRPKPVNSLIGSARSSSSIEDSDKLFTEFESDALTNPKAAMELTKKKDLVCICLNVCLKISITPRLLHVTSESYGLIVLSGFSSVSYWIDARQHEFCDHAKSPSHVIAIVDLQ